MTHLPKLEDLLHYHNPQVIKRFQLNYPKQTHEADQLFIEMLKYLWLSRKYEQDLHKNPRAPELQFAPVMHEEMRDIDHMWHEFILMTIDYHQFCQDYFGGYLHHVPNMREEIQLTEQEFEAQLELFLVYVYDNLGEDTITYWFRQHLETVP